MKDSIISYTFLFLAEIVIMVIGAATQVMWLFYLFLALILIEAVLISISGLLSNTSSNVKNAAQFSTRALKKSFSV